MYMEDLLKQHFVMHNQRRSRPLSVGGVETEYKLALCKIFEVAEQMINIGASGRDVASLMMDLIKVGTT
jgi:hypothetical protein